MLKGDDGEKGKRGRKGTKGQFGIPGRPVSKVLEILALVINPVPANCPYFDHRKGGKKSDFTMCPYFCKNLSVVMYKKFRNVPILQNCPPICSYFLGFRVVRYVTLIKWAILSFLWLGEGLRGSPSSRSCSQHAFTKGHIVSWEPEGRYCSSKMFCWESEGRYHHRLCTAKAPFWFSTQKSLNCNNALVALNWWYGSVTERLIFKRSIRLERNKIR